MKNAARRAFRNKVLPIILSINEKNLDKKRHITYDPLPSLVLHGINNIKTNGSFVTPGSQNQP